MRPLAFTVCCLFLFAVSVCHGQHDFFLSTSGLNEGAVNSNATVSKKVGDVGSLFVYYTTGGPSASDLTVGAMLDFQTSTAGVIKFTDAETFDFDIVFDDSIVLCERWGANSSGGGGAFGNTGNVSDNLINELSGFTTLGGFGIEENHNGSGLFFDTGFDPQADAFLFARIDYAVVGPGQVDIVPNVGDGLVVSRTNSPNVLNPVFGIATIDSSGFALGDINMDGSVDLLDVQPFIDLIFSGEFIVQADFNMDGQVNLLDVAGFIEAITNSPFTGSGNDEDGEQGNGDGPMESGNCSLGDLDQSGSVDLLDDIDLISLLLEGGFQCEGDIDQDGKVNLLDVRFFVELTAGFGGGK